jgi:hypothetical protein
MIFQNGGKNPFASVQSLVLFYLQLVKSLVELLHGERLKYY